MHYDIPMDQAAFTVGNIDAVSVIRGKDYSHSYRNGREKHGFIYLIQGSMTGCFVDPAVGKMHLKSGQLLFVPKNTEYVSVYNEDDTRVRIIQFDLLTGRLPTYLSRPVRLELPQGRELVNELFVPQNPNGAMHPFACLSGLYGLLWQIDRLYSDIPPRYRRLKNALQAMAEGVPEDRGVTEYAALCGMGEVTFRRLFKEYTGCAPIEYRNDLRLSSARAKLQSGEYNVTEAAEACGFRNLSFFIRLYKKKYGYTPKKE